MASTIEGETLQELPSETVVHLLNKHQIAQSQLSYSLIPLDREKEEKIDSFQADLPFIPASTSKILILAMMMKDFLSDEKLKTQIFISGDVKDKTLHGNLYLIGQGDPFLTYNSLANLALALKEKGIQRIKGNFYFQSHSTGHALSDFGHRDQTYNPAVGTLNLEFNQFRLIQKRPQRSWSTIPPLEHLKIETTNQSFLPGQNFQKNQNDKKTESWTLSAKQQYPSDFRVPVHHPELFTAQALKHFAPFFQVDLPSPQALKQKLPSSAQLIASLPSRDISALSHSMMEFSNNLFAEILLKVWAQRQESTSSFNNNLSVNAQLMLKRLKSDYPDLDFSSWQLVNASGLSSENQVTALAMSKLIKKWQTLRFDNSPIFFPSFLSLSGHSGWMARRLNSPATIHRVWAKTGSLDYIVNLVGILQSTQGQRYAFTLFLNDQNSRKELDQLIETARSAESFSPQSKSRLQALHQNAEHWNRRAQSFADELLTLWLDSH